MNIDYFDYWRKRELGDPRWNWVHQYTHDICPFCRVQLIAQKGPWNNPDVIAAYEKPLSEVNQFLHILRVEQCPSCNWWQVELGIGDLDSLDYGVTDFYQATIKNIDIASKQVAVDELARYLAKKAEHIYHIHHKKMEELVASVLSEHFGCNVIHCGQSHDRGTDLLLIEDDEITAIQVKRRMKAGYAEGVSVVRDMLGVIFRDELKSAIIVTTADHFSAEAKKDVREVIDKGLVNRFELIDLPTFTRILRQHYKPMSDSYLAVIPDKLKMLE